MTNFVSYVAKCVSSKIYTSRGFREFFFSLRMPRRTGVMYEQIENFLPPEFGKILQPLMAFHLFKKKKCVGEYRGCIGSLFLRAELHEFFRNRWNSIFFAGINTWQKK